LTGVDLPPGGAQAGGQQPARGLDRRRDRVFGAVAVPGEQFQQGGGPGRVVADAPSGQQLPGGVHQGDVLVVFGPVDSAEHFHKLHLLVVCTTARAGQAARVTHAP
jgi:hypothetical protein